jgi:hypothetical protein
MKTALPCAVMLVVVLIGAPGYPVASLTLYDNFNAKYIDPAKWFGAELGPEPAGADGEAGTEAIRRIRYGRLRLLYRAYGRMAPKSERTRRELALIFRNSPDVTAIQATVKVTAVATTGCPGNSEYTLAWARLGGRFFASGGADVVAVIYLGRRSVAPEPSNVLHARAGVFSCDDLACTTPKELFSQDLGTVQLWKTVKLRVQWDQGSHRFIFQRDRAKEVEMPYKDKVTDTDKPSYPDKLLSATLFVPDCTTTTRRPMAFIDALFDDVRVIK